MTEQNNRCVYVHKDKHGNVFYVGSGTLQRANTKQLSKSKNRGTCRGKPYSMKVEELNFEYGVEILHYNLSKEKSIEIECNEIIRLREEGHLLVNINLPTTGVPLNLEFLKEYFYLDETSPTGLRWNKDGSGRSKFKFGEIAGKSSRTDLYYCVSLFGKNYLVHRIIMTILGHDLNGKVVDHIDGDGFNNSLDNLRVVTQAENLRNLSKRTDNTSGHTGINYCEQRQHWKVNWYENGERFVKCFRIGAYDNDKEKALSVAIEFRKSVMERLNYPIR